MKLFHLVVILSFILSSFLYPMNRSRKKRKIDQLSIEQVSAKRRKLLKLINNKKALADDSSAFDSEHFASPQQQLLFIAACEGDYTTINYMRDHRINMNVNKRTPKGLTLLQYAAKDGNVRATKMLLKYSARINAQSRKGKTALHYAVRHNHFDVVQALFGHKVSVLVSDEIRSDLLCCAVKSGSIDMVNFLSRKDLCDFYSDTLTVLPAAVQNNDIKMVKFLLDKDFSMYRFISEACPALSVAIANGFTECAELLLQNGVRFSEKNVYPLLQKLLTLGVDVNATYKDGQTLLHFVAESGDVQSARLLLKKKNIDVDQSDDYGFTPLLQAVHDNNAAIVQLLLATNKVNVNAHTIDYETPLQLAVSDKSQEIIYMLLRAGARDLKQAWEDSYSEIKQMVKYCDMLGIPQLWHVVRTLRKNIEQGKIDLKNKKDTEKVLNLLQNQQSEKALYVTLQQKQKVFDRFVLVMALEQGWSTMVGRVTSLQNQFAPGVMVVVEKMNQLKQAACAGDLQQVCVLLQKKYLLPDQLKVILNDRNVMDQTVKDIMEKRLALQTNRNLKPQDVETIFADYVTDVMCNIEDEEIIG